MPAGNPRTLTVMADTLLAAGCEQDREQLDEKLFLETLGEPAQARQDTAVKGFPTRAPGRSREPAAPAALAGRRALGASGSRHRRLANPSAASPSSPSTLPSPVAAGVPCLRSFAAEQQGPVLLFCAEDAGHIVRDRLEGIASAAGADFRTLDIAVIDVPALRPRPP